MDADVTIGNLGSLKADLIGAVSFDATYVYFHQARTEAAGQAAQDRSLPYRPPSATVCS